MTSHVNKAKALIPLVLTLLCSSIYAGDLRELSDFDAIEVGGGIDLYLRQDEDFKVEVESSGDADDVITEVHNGKLSIHHRRGFNFRFWLFTNPDTVYISLPELSSLQASGGSDVRFENHFTVESLKVESSGGSDVFVDLTADLVDLHASGGADLDVAGSGRRLVAEVSGGSDLNARRFEALEAEISASGGSDGILRVRDKITVRASGGSDVHYIGKPGERDVSASGGSDVSSSDD